MDLVHRCLKPAVQAPQLIRLLDQLFPLHNLSKLDTEDTQHICSNKAMDCTVAKLAPTQVV